MGRKRRPEAVLQDCGIIAALRDTSIGNYVDTLNSSEKCNAGSEESAFDRIRRAIAQGAREYLASHEVLPGWYLEDSLRLLVVREVTLKGEERIKRFTKPRWNENLRVLESRRLKEAVRDVLDLDTFKMFYDRKLAAHGHTQYFHATPVFYNTEEGLTSFIQDNCTMDDGNVRFNVYPE